MELNPFSHELHEDPCPTYRWLRENAPLYRNERLDFWALSRFRDVLEASCDWQTSSSAEGTTVERIDGALFGERPMTIFTDPPRHDRLRKLVSRAFTPRRVAELEPFARQTVVGLLDRIVESGEGDFVKDRRPAQDPDRARLRPGRPLLPRGVARAAREPGHARGGDPPLPAPRGRRGALQARAHEQRARLRERPVLLVSGAGSRPRAAQRAPSAAQANASQPAMNETPPIGVIAPSQRWPLSTST